MPGDAEVAEADQCADELMEDLRVNIENSDHDVEIVLFAMWAKMTYILAGWGWPADELSRDVHSQAARAISQGRIQCTNETLEAVEQALAELERKGLVARVDIATESDR